MPPSTRATRTAHGGSRKEIQPVRRQSSTQQQPKALATAHTVGVIKDVVANYTSSSTSVSRSGGVGGESVLYTSNSLPRPAERWSDPRDRLGARLVGREHDHVRDLPGHKTQVAVV